MYHWRALRFRKKLWRPFAEHIDEWLESWNPQSSELLLLGPSAGYCLPKRFLSRFHRVIFVEPDPVARLFFRQKYFTELFRSKNMRSIELFNALRSTRSLTASNALLDPSPVKFLKLIESFPNAAVLFSNVLGQLSLYAEELASKSKRPWCLNPGAIENVLANRNWASFHDRLSGAGHVSLESFTSESGSLSNELLASFFFDEVPHGLVDHDCALFPHTREARYWAWELTPGHFHLIEGIKIRQY